MRVYRRLLAGLAGCLGLVFLTSGVGAQAPAPPAKPVAVVNGEPIPMADLDRIVGMIVQEKFKVQPPTEQQRRQVRMEVLNMLVNDILMRQFLHKNGTPVEPAAVDKEMSDFIGSFQAQKPPRTFGDFCKETGQTETQIRATVTAMLQWSAYVKSHVTDADVQKFYEESKDFFDQVAVRASHIVLRVPAEASETDRKGARDKLTTMRADIVAGKLDFGEAAKKFSQCPSAPNGGDIGFFSRKGMLDENFAKTAYSLKVNEVSDVVQTDYGFHLIKVTDRKAGQPSDFAKIKDEVKDFYVEEMRLRLITQENKVGKIEINLP